MSLKFVVLFVQIIALASAGIGKGKTEEKYLPDEHPLFHADKKNGQSLPDFPLPLPSPDTIKWPYFLNDLPSISFKPLPQIPFVKKPNVVIIEVANVGFNDFSFRGSNQIPTPNIDALAYSGCILNRFYTQPYGFSSKAAMYTGKYPVRLGLQGTPPSPGQLTGVSDTESLMPEMFQYLGYSTNFVGTWGLGFQTEANTPLANGFDTFFGSYNSETDYFNYEASVDLGEEVMSGFDLRDGKRSATELKGRYATTLYTNKAVDIIYQHKSGTPLFLHLSHLGARANSEGHVEVPDIASNDINFSYIKDEKRRRYAGAVAELDKSVGHIMSALLYKGLLSNTIVVFLSSSGGATIGEGANGASNFPLRGVRGTLHEGSVRTNAIMWAPFLNIKGQINNEIIHITDLLPTLFAACGGDPQKLVIDGTNQLDVIKYGSATKRKNTLINIDEVQSCGSVIGTGGRYKLVVGSCLGAEYHQYHGETGASDLTPTYDHINILSSAVNIAIRKTTFFTSWLNKEKLLKIRGNLDVFRNCSDEQRAASAFYLCDGVCLYDLLNDPCETNDIADQQFQITAYLKFIFSQYQSTMIPQEPPTVDLDSNPEFCPNKNWHSWLDNNPKNCGA